MISGEFINSQSKGVYDSVSSSQQTQSEDPRQQLSQSVSHIHAGLTGAALPQSVNQGAKRGGCWKGADPFHRKQGDGRPIRCWISGRSVCPWDGSSGGFHHSDATEPPSREIRAVNSAQASDKSDLRSFEKASDVFTARLSSGGVLSCSEGSDGDGRGTRLHILSRCLTWIFR